MAGGGAHNILTFSEDVYAGKDGEVGGDGVRGMVSDLSLLI